MVGWFEIPVSDMARAKHFYESVFDISIEIVNFGNILMGWFPNKGAHFGATGTLIKQESYIPSKEGVLIYFSCLDLRTELSNVEQTGGIIYQPKTKNIRPIWLYGSIY